MNPLISLIFLSVIFISFYLLTSRTRDDTVELIDSEKKFSSMVLFCVLEITFYGLI